MYVEIQQDFYVVSFQYSLAPRKLMNFTQLPVNYRHYMVVVKKGVIVSRNFSTECDWQSFSKILIFS